MNKVLKLVIVLIIVSVVFGCSQKKENIKIGYTAGLSGRHSQLSIFLRTGIEIAIDEINQMGGINGRTLELVVKDNRGDKKVQQETVQELVDEGVKLLIGPILSSMVQVTIDAVSANKMLILSPTAGTDKLKGIDDNFIRLAAVSSVQGSIIANEIVKQDHARIAVVYDASNRDYTESVYLSFKEHLESFGKSLVYVNDMNTSKSKNFLKIAQDVKSSKCDVLFFITNSLDAATISQQLEKLNYRGVIYGSHWVKAGNVIQHGGKSVEGMIIVTSYEAKSPSQKLLRFKRIVKDQYSQKPIFIHVSGYDAVQILAEGMRLSSEIIPQKIKKRILEKRVFETLQQQVTFDNYGDVTRMHSLVKIDRGNYKKFKDIDYYK